ncbi:CaiB/BaiF CoA transferase family protein [Arthrobacter globiformis]|uniref:CaiB/BaiF CoA transferase family protein n=1 Tax=Arthrobacter globiformis TaxID=1665 RepID=UPI00278CC6E3|nr:CoA transferase [Arthrobacter globiformis]MDQ0616669.1 crotonobetainyl-CoA:carnitine CoA-transferase CaiB-like acyl-CoA transferase [Arthrobacter globiformis]
MGSADVRVRGTETSHLPLAGIRIVDLSQIGAGPYGTSMLGDLGADVIKIEPLEGESFRHIDNLFGEGDSAYFYGVNRSKRSLALDLHSEGGRRVLERLLADADVMVVAFRPDAVRRLGIRYEDVAGLNDQLIYCSITAFGEDGPRAHQPGMDILAQGMGGIMGLTGEAGGAPVKVGVPIADFAGSFLLGFAVSAALRGRDLNGVGQKVTINLLDGQVANLANILTHYDRTKIPVRPHGGGHAQLVPYQPFRGSDGRYFIVACLNDRFWQRLGAAVERHDLVADNRFRTNPDRVRNRSELIRMLEKIFATLPASEWLELLDEKGVPCGPIHRLEDVFNDPQVQHNESIIWLEHPEHGSYPVPNLPIRFEQTPGRPRGYAPRLGEHSLEILAEAGFTDEEAVELIRSGDVRSFSVTAPPVVP